jgi:uncharacterized protein
MDLDPALKKRADAAVNTLMDQVKGIKAAVVSTEDGFEVASRVENTAQVARLSAMASSLAALGALAGEESQLGVCDSLTMEAEGGFIAILQVRLAEASLILSVVTGRDAVLGQVLYFARQAVQSMGPK